MNQFVTPIKLNSNSNVLDVALNSSGTAFLDQSSYVWTSSISNNVPVPLFGDIQFARFTNGSGTGVSALDASSYAWVGGVNNNGQIGNNSIYPNYVIPQSVVGGLQWSTLYASVSGFFVGLTSSSYAWAWGYNYYGQLGDNTTNNRSSPVSVIGGRQFIKIVCATSDTCALDSSSYAWAWGSNFYGIGDNTTINRSSPTSVVGGRQFIDIQMGVTENGNPYFLATDSSSYIWGWGDNRLGNFGNNPTSQTYAISPISVLNNNWNKLYVAGSMTYGINSNNNVYVWGGNHGGQFGNNSTISTSSPLLVNVTCNGNNIFGYGGSNIKKLAGYMSNGGGAVLLDKSSNVWAWGNISTGDGFSTSRSTAVRPLMYPRNYKTWSPSFTKIVQGGTITTLYLDSSSYAWYWGYYTGGTSQSKSPISVPTNIQWRQLRLGSNVGNNATSSNISILGLDPLSYAWAWGCPSTDYGQMGINRDVSTGVFKLPQSVVGGKQWLNIVPDSLSSYGIDSSSYLWWWGYNWSTGISTSSPTSVLGGRKVRKVAVQGGSYNNSCFLDISSYAWVWGFGSDGQMGNNTASAFNNSPVSVIGNRQFTNIGAALWSFFAIDASSYLWSWGCNDYGNLGDGTTNDRSSPVSVIGGRQFIWIPDNNSSQSMIAFDGSSYAWTWGWNRYGQLGDGTQEIRSSPVSLLGAYKLVDATFLSTSLLGVISYPGNQVIACGYQQAGVNNLVNYFPDNVSCSVAVLSSLHTYITSPVIVRKNILGK